LQFGPFGGEERLPWSAEERIWSLDIEQAFESASAYASALGEPACGEGSGWQDRGRLSELKGLAECPGQAHGSLCRIDHYLV
jgi:hypothetical protein